MKQINYQNIWNKIIKIWGSGSTVIEIANEGQMGVDWLENGVS